MLRSRPAARAGVAPPPVRHVDKIALDPEMSADDALQLIGRRCMAALQANVPAALTGCPEGIHQLRIAARRFRSFLSAMKTVLPRKQYAWANGELRWLANAVGPARNWDVITERLVKPVARSTEPERVDLQALTEFVERERRAAYDQAKSALQSPQFRRSIVALSRWLEARQWRSQPAGRRSARRAAPIEEVAPDLLKRHLRQARKRGRRLRRAGVTRRHRLRIAVKKLRYTIDFLRSLYGAAEVDRFSRRVERLQDELGDSHDLRIAQQFLARLDRRQPRADVTRAAGFVLGWQGEQIAAREHVLHKQFRKFRHLDPFW